MRSTPNSFLLQALSRWISVVRFEKTNAVSIVVVATVLATNMTPRHAVIWGKPEGMDGVESIDIVATNAATTATNAVVLSIATEKASYSIREPVKLIVSLKKFGLGNVSFWRGVSLISFRDLYVIPPNDMRAKETEYCHQLEFNHFGGGADRRNLTGGEEAKDSLEINRLFDMTLSGYYKIFVGKEVSLSAPECKCKMMLQTPAITIRITEKQ